MRPGERIRALAGSATSLRGQLVRGGAGSLLNRLGGVVLSFAVTVVLARSLRPEEYGIYAYVLALVMLLTIPVRFGLPALVVREISASRQKAEWGVLCGVIRWTSRAVAVLGLAVVAVAGVLGWLFADHFSQTQLATFAFGLLLVPCMAFIRLYGSALRGLQRVVQGQLPNQVLRPALLIALLLVAWILLPRQAYTPALAMALHAAATLLALGVGLWLFRAARPAEAMSAAPEYRTRHWAGAVLPLGLTAAIMLINRNMDVLLIGMFLPVENVGIYRAIAQAALTVTFGLQAVNAVVAPYISRLYHANEMARLQRMATWSARAMLAIAIPVALVLIFAGEPVLSFALGEGYAAGADALAILCLGKIVHATMGSGVLLLNMSGHERDTLRASALVVAANAIMNLLLIPYWGIEGAAAATTASLVLLNILLWRRIRARLGIQAAAFPIPVRANTVP